MNFKGRLFRSFSYKMFPKLLIKKSRSGGGGTVDPFPESAFGLASWKA